MKVGVITFHNAHNYGASLQALALQRVLKDLKCEPVLIHYHPAVIDDLYEPVNERGLKRLFKKSRMYLKKRPRARLIKYKHYQSFIQKNFKLLGDYVSPDELNEEELKLDAYITGSDQVFNPTHTGGYDKAYTLEFVKKARKLSYAASVGATRVEDIYREDFKRSLSSFDAVSVREESAKADIEELSGLPVSVTLDPTLLLDRKAYDVYKKPSQFSEKYILVYMMEKNKKMIALVNKISKAVGYPVIQRKLPGIFTNECGSYYTHDPGEFLGDIEGAEFVITNSFHGTVFSILYEKPFLSMLHSATGARTVDLLTALGLESHLIYDPDEFRELERMKIRDMGRVKERIAALREESIEFLKRGLGL